MEGTHHRWIQRRAWTFQNGLSWSHHSAAAFCKFFSQGGSLVPHDLNPDPLQNHLSLRVESGHGVETCAFLSIVARFPHFIQMILAFTSSQGMWYVAVQVHVGENPHEQMCMRTCPLPYERQLRCARGFDISSC